MVYGDFYTELNSLIYEVVSTYFIQSSFRIPYLFYVKIQLNYFRLINIQNYLLLIYSFGLQFKQQEWDLMGVREINHQSSTTATTLYLSKCEGVREIDHQSSTTTTTLYLSKCEFNHYNNSFVQLIKSVFLLDVNVLYTHTYILFIHHTVVIFFARTMRVSPNDLSLPPSRPNTTR